MSIQALEIFKQKYPQYANSDDLEIATALAKRSSSYADLPRQVAMDRNLSNPDMQGGVNAPALKQAQKDLRQNKLDASVPFTILKGLDDTAKFIGPHELGLPTKVLALPTTVPASIALDVQSGKPQDIIPNLGKVVTDQRSPTYKDVLKGAGVQDNVAGPSGMAMDVVLYPGGAKGAVELVKATPKAIKSVPSLVKGGFNYVKDAFTGAEKAKIAADEAKFALRQSTAQQTREISKKTGMKVDIVRKNQEAVNQGYEDLSNTLKKMITKESDKQGLQMQKDLPKLFEEKSTAYKTERDALIEGKNISVQAKDALKPIENALEQHGILRMENGQLVISRAPMTPAEHEIYNLYSKMKGYSTNAPIPVEDLMRTQKFTRPEFGRQWDADDKLKAAVSKNLDGLIKDVVPGFKELQAKYKPFLEWKDSVINKIKPFNNKYEVESRILSRTGSGELQPDELRLMAELEQQLGKQVGGKVPALQKGLSSIVDKQAAAKSASAEVIKQMRQDAADKIFSLRQAKNLKTHEIDQAVNQLVHKYKTRQLKIGIAGAASLGGIATNTLNYFFRREIYSGLKN